MTRTVLAPAKINLCLHVLGKRPDGYHDLAMLMQRISLYDRLEISLGAEPGIRVSCAGVALPPGDENIAAKAARRMLELAASQDGVEIVIDKRIPVAAGLGGGSSDAAAVLLALNEMLGLNLSRQRLQVEGARLGADVPFFVFGADAWATGIGDVLTAVPPLPRLWYVLVNPQLAVSTAWVYQNLRLTTKGVDVKLPRLLGTGEGLVRLLHNDLETVTIGRHPELAELKARLMSLGATGALMSGSGPTVFGLFADESSARTAAAVLAEDESRCVFVVQPVGS
ncbi:MAG TPA: 4-(cytidine 5'-diphospho)-2-C-methyl-D-erythritol kinase [Desulfuromonadales bacterium]|nr:4-(cytidine 5'-diphospho)-2-C-methyl-D-erythritol kinase [Desulfuromonadales bacterium]